MSDRSDKAAVLAALRTRIRRLEGIGGQAGQAWPFGLAGLDAALPDGGLPLAGLHEITGDGVADQAAAIGFAAVVAAGIAARGPEARPVLWLGRRLELYAPGLLRFGLPPHRVILAEAERNDALLWATEEGLRCAGLAAVVAELAPPGLTASRRLQLAAEASGVTALMVHPAAARGTLSAAVTRWRVATRPGPGLTGPGLTGPGVVGPERANFVGSCWAVPCWRLTLDRCRAGRLDTWHVVWDGQRLIDVAETALAPGDLPSMATPSHAAAVDSDRLAA